MNKKEVASELLKMAKELTSASGDELSDDDVNKAMRTLREASNLFTKYSKHIKRAMMDEKELRSNWGIYGGKNGVLSEAAKKLNKLAKEME